MKTEYIVEMTHITKTFPGVRALDDVTFNLKSGEVLACSVKRRSGKVYTDESAQRCLHQRWR